MLSVGRNIGRTTLRAWGRAGRASGYQYRVIESYGHSLAEDYLLHARLPNGCRVKCELRDEVQRLMWFYGLYEPIESYLFNQLLQPGMVVIDVGANVGQYTMLASTAVGRLGSVHSFEPVPSTFARLNQHISDNSLMNVYLNNAAIWHEETSIALGLPTDMINNAGAYTVGVGSDSASRVEVHTLTLDNYADRHNLARVDVIKMDIEGAEPAAIAGGLGVIRKFRPLILAEVNRAALIGAGYSTVELWTIVSGLGYRVWRIGQSLEDSGPVRDLESVVQGNVLFHHGDLPRRITSGWTLRGVLHWARSRL